MSEILKFTEFHNILFSSLICLTNFAVFFNAHKLYSKTNDSRMAIIAVGFLIGGFFELFHTGYAYLNDYVYDCQILKSIMFIYLSFSNIGMSSSILFSFILPIESREKPINLKKIYVYSILAIFLMMFIVEIFHHFNHDFLFIFSQRVILNNPSLEVLDNVLYILSAILFIEMKKLNNHKIFSKFLVGLLLLGIGQLYIVSPEYLGSFYRFYIHISKIAGVFLVFSSLTDILNDVKIGSFKYKLIAYPSLILIVFNLIFVSLILSTFNITLPQESQYIFVFFFLITVIFLYILSNKLTSQITNAIYHVERLSSDKRPLLIPIKTNDEVGILIEKINESNIQIWENNNELLSKQQQIIEANAREQFLRKITDSIRKTLDIKEIFNLVCQEIGLAFKVDRVGIFEFPDSEKYWEWISRGEYKAKKEIIGLDYPNLGMNDPTLNRKLGETWGKCVFLEAEPIIINNIAESDKTDCFKEIYLSRGVKSVIGIPIKSANHKWGLLGLSTYDDYKYWTDEEVSLLKDISNQLFIAIQQAELLENIKNQAQREHLLRKITETIRNSLDINEIKNNIVSEVGKTFNADRCFIRLYESDNVFLTIDSEYLSSPNVKSSKDYKFPDGFNQFVKKCFKEHQPIIILDNQKVINDPNFEPSFRKFILDLDIKSNYSFPIFNNNEFIGAFVVQYTQQIKDLDNESIELLKMISAQAGIALYQAKLFSAITQKAEHERLLKEVISTSKSNLEINEILASICEKISKAYGVQRVSIIDFKGITNEEMIISEYRQNNVKRVKESRHYNSGLMNYWLTEVTHKDQTFIINDITTSDFPEELKPIFESINVKAFLGVSLKIADDKLGALFIFNYSSPRYWTDNEISTLHIIKEHISMAIREKNLYNHEKFLTNISHELKTPIAIINSYTEALINREQNKSETSEKFLGIIKKNIDRLTNLIDDLLYLSAFKSSIENEKQEFALIEIIDVIKSCIELCEQKAVSKNIEIHINYKKSLFVNINTLLLQQALINLINNAINYSDIGTYINISADDNETEILISVQDHGCGIKEEHFENIFKRFYRVDKSRSRETGGSGLGLSIVQKIVEFHGGYVTFDSTFEKGSTFTIHLLK